MTYISPERVKQCKEQINKGYDNTLELLALVCVFEIATRHNVGVLIAALLAATTWAVVFSKAVESLTRQTGLRQNATRVALIVIQAAVLALACFFL